MAPKGRFPGVVKNLSIEKIAIYLKTYYSLMEWSQAITTFWSTMENKEPDIRSTPVKSDVDKKFYADLGQRIATSRKAADITQTALAEILDIGQQTMGHYESGRLRIPIRLLKQIADVFDMPYNSLIDGHPVDSSAPVKRGPRSAIETTFMRVAELPRHKQKSIQDVVEAMLLKEAS